MFKIISVMVFALALFLVSGCAIMPPPTVPYEYGEALEGQDVLRLATDEPQVEQGEPHAFLDWVGHNVISLPSKLILWNWDVANHNISPETEDILMRYLADNVLHNVKVRLNDYSPGDEWRRLFANESVEPFWRYTLGVISVSYYTIIPDRFFAGLLGGDNYNPYTNTINLYSDHPAIGLHEAGHAKDFAGQEDKGFYAAMRLLPIVPLIQESNATSDALGYLIDKKAVEEEKSAYEVLYPAYGTYVFGAGLFGAAYEYVPIDEGVKLAANGVGIVLGHITGRDKSNEVEQEDSSPAVKAVPVEVTGGPQNNNNEEPKRL